MTDATLPENADDVINQIAKPLESSVRTIPAASATGKGFVSKIDIGGPVTEDVSTSKITQMKNDIASAYGITPEEVTMTVDYVAKGTLKMTFNSTMTEQEAMDSITKAIR